MASELENALWTRMRDAEAQVIELERVLRVIARLPDKQHSPIAMEPTNIEEARRRAREALFTDDLSPLNPRTRNEGSHQ